MSGVTAVEKAYVAGLLDGDGSVMAPMEPHRECRFRYRIRVVVKFSQHEDHDQTLMELKALCGDGYVSQSNKRVREFAVKSSRGVERLLRDIEPYVRIKRTQVRQALALMEQLKHVQTLEQFRRVAELADQLSAGNLKSRSRRKHSSQSIARVPVTTDPARVRSPEVLCTAGDHTPVASSSERLKV